MASYVAGGIAVAVAAWLYESTETIPSGNEAIVLRMGQFDRVIKSGTHLIGWPICKLAVHEWQFVEENRATHEMLTVTRRFTKIPKSRQVFDVQPISAMSKDRIEVTINLVFHYCIHDSKSLLQAPNVGRLLQDVTESGIITYTQHAMAEDIKANGLDAIKEHVMKYVGEMTAKLGVTILDVLVQDIVIEADFDKEVTILEHKSRKAAMELKHCEGITYADSERRRLELGAEREHKLARVEMDKMTALGALQAEKERAMFSARVRLDQQETEIEYSRKDADLKHELTIKEAESALARDMVNARVLEKMRADGTLEAFVCIERAKYLGRAMSKMNPRIVVANPGDIMGTLVADKLTDKFTEETPK